MAMIRGLFWVFKEIANKVEQDIYNEDAAKNELMEIYRMLEAGEMTEQEFGIREASLIERIDAIEQYKKNKYQKRRV
jgi:hypothetical protein